ncbi:hypothetical protein Lal_00003161 [Lupinus albus]|nr:hypothetical protein Lal_00003161 [Lupinus albus]
MVSTRSMARNAEEWIQEREEMRREREEQRIRIELNEARTKRLEETLTQLTLRSRFPNSSDEGSGIGGEHEIHDIRGREKWRKLEIPLFSGDDAFGWTHRLERYFNLKEVADEEKMQATLLALEGKALSWYQWWGRCNPQPSWEGFKLAVIRRFQPSMVQNPFEQLLALKQLGTVEEYVEEFEKYVGALKEIDPEFVKGIFLNGLKEEVRVEVRLYEHPTLSEVIHKSIMIEEKNVILQKKISPNPYARPTSFNRSNFPTRSVTVESKPWLDKKVESTSVGSNARSYSSPQTGDNQRSRAGVFKHLTGTELREKRDKGLCFRCDEPYSKEHRCKNRQFKMIVMEEEDEDIEMGTEETMLTQMHSLQLSLWAMAGLTSTNSWKMAGLLEGEKVMTLIDCGASHNFISAELVEKLQLKVQTTPRYVVEVGDGHRIHCQGKCEALKLVFQDLEVVQEFYLFGLKGIDVVLGLEWLASLGEVKADFGKLELTLRKGGTEYKLQGDPALTKTQLSLGAFMQVLKEEGEGLMLHYDGPENTSASSQPVAVEVLEVLQQFEELFEDPQGLPPKRRYDHAIHLKEGANIPNIRPYKYPHYQKTEIERLFIEKRDLLKTCLN